MTAALITLREGLEAALVVAIIAMYLNRTGRHERIRQVWVGVLAAVALSLGIGILVHLGVADLPHRVQEATEGFAALLAAGVLTWMIFWMRAQARSLRGNLEHKVDEAVGRGSAIALPLLAFTAVVREGLETVLFLFAAFNASADTRGSSAGAVVGLLAAAGIGYAFYQGGRRVNLRLFFQITGVLVIILSAGLLASAIHEFNEAGMLMVMTDRIWDTSRLIGKTGLIPALLRGFIGYDPQPTALQALVYWAYLLPTLWLFLGRSSPATRVARSIPAEA